MADADLHKTLPFPPYSTQHILNCCYYSWYSRYRSKTPKARLIPLTPQFITYLKSDGILLPPDSPQPPRADDDSGYSDASDESDEDPSEQWPGIHAKITATIKELGGKVLPKLNWSAPKDATWISTTNDMDCTTANEIYLLLKSSDFITHDLEQAFDGCSDVTSDNKSALENSIRYTLTLRKSFNLNPSLEFRCFVRNRRLIAISQREMNYFSFLSELVPIFRRRIETFFEETLRNDFPDPNFTFDVYIPPPHERVWLIDINPWAPRTDPLLFSWLELLTMDEPSANTGAATDYGVAIDGAEEADEEVNVEFVPEFRLVQRDDPEAYQFASTKYSAHKLPRDVVDAGVTPGGMKDMMEEWRRVMDGEVGSESSSEGEHDVDVDVAAHS